jgi:hypothetical protein
MGLEPPWSVRKCSHAVTLPADSVMASRAVTAASSSALDDAAFSGGVATLEEHADLRSKVLHPELQLNQLDLKMLEGLLEVLATYTGRASLTGVTVERVSLGDFHLRSRLSPLVVLVVLAVFCHSHIFRSVKAQKSGTSAMGMQYGGRLDSAPRAPG